MNSYFKEIWQGVDAVDKSIGGRREWGILILLFILALCFRIYHLFSLDVWFDEVAILLQTTLSFGGIWEFCKNENFPPLYPWLVKLWGFLGTSTDWMRFLDALIGAAVPPAAYLLGRAISGRKLGLLLALACVISLPLFYFSQVIRMYSLFVLLSCLSYYGFLLGLVDGRWRYWWLTAAANLLGFYTFLFMIFVIISEFLVLVYFYRFTVRRYSRAMLAHLPAVLLMSLWLMTLLTRYRVHNSYVPSHLSFSDLTNFWIYLGWGYKVPGQKLLMIIANLPFALGLIIGVKQWRKSPSITAVVLMAASALLIICVISLVGQSVFFDRYLLFLLPIYLALALIGWMSLPSRLWRSTGLVCLFGSLFVSQGYYWTHYQIVNDEFRHHGTYQRPADDDGRSMSRTAAAMARDIRPDEVIIHYSGHWLKCFSYFDFIYYHKRSLREYIYSAQEIPVFVGRPYLRPGEHIYSLRDLSPLPNGIWVVTLNSVALLERDSPYNLAFARIIREEGDLPEELENAGYVLERTSRDGAVSVAYFRRSKDSDPAPASGKLD